MKAYQLPPYGPVCLNPAFTARIPGAQNKAGKEGARVGTGMNGAPRWKIQYFYTRRPPKVSSSFRNYKVYVPINNPRLFYFSSVGEETSSPGLLGINTYICYLRQPREGRRTRGAWRGQTRGQP